MRKCRSEADYHFMKLRRLALFSVLIALPLALPAAAAAGEVSPRVGHTVVDDVLWVDASIKDAPVERVVIKVTASRRGPSQVCKLAFTGEGIYRCGIEVGDGSARDRAADTWRATVLLDGEVVASARIRL